MKAKKHLMAGDFLDLFESLFAEAQKAPEWNERAKRVEHAAMLCMDTANALVGSRTHSFTEYAVLDGAAYKAWYHAKFKDQPVNDFMFIHHRPSLVRVMWVNADKETAAIRQHDIWTAGCPLIFLTMLGKLQYESSEKG